MADIIYNFLLLLDGVIYNLIDWLYDIFDFLARVNIFSNDTYSEIVQRIYVILGLFMLFVLAYSLLKATINPDEFAKGENSFPSLIKNVVISLAIIVLLPMIFTVAFNIQNVVLNNDTIPRLLLGNSFEDQKDSDAGHRMAYYTFRAFFHENEDWCESEGYSISDGTCAQNIRGNGGWFDRNGEPLSDVRAGIENGESFSNYSNYGEAVTAGEIQYMFLLSTAAGIFLIYVLLNFCFDLAVRVVKLAFYQIIAPIPVVCRILPGGNMKDVFSKWVKQVISVFLEVFIRIGIMNLGVFLITEIIDNFDGISGLNSLDFTQQCIVMALLIMGVVIFIRQAPKLLGDLLHLDTGGMKLGLMDKLAMGGGLLAGAAVGGIATAGARNLFAGGRNVLQRGKQTVQNVRSARGGRDKTKALLGGAAGVAGSIIGGAASTVAGAASGGVRAGRGGIKAKNFKDMAGAAGKGASEATAARFKRASYKANHRITSIAGHDITKIPVIGGAMGALGGVVGTGLGHAGDMLHGAAQWAGVNNLDSLIADNKVVDEISAKRDAVKKAAQDLILGEARKNKNKSFGIDSSRTFSDRSNLGLQYSAFTTKNLRDLQQKMEVAKQTGYAQDFYGVNVSAQEWEDLYGKYLSEFTDEVQNQAFQSTEHYKTMINSSADPLGMEADFSALQGAVSDFKRTVRDNINNDAVVQAGLTASMLNGENDLKVKDPAMDNLGKTLKIVKTQNIEKINKIRNRENKNDGK